ncbi:MAG: class I SAM-dependent methyltransferase [Bacteriovoracia bacterium]
MKMGFAYQSVGVYRFIMRLLYGREYLKKYTTVSELIPQGSFVVDLCCGDCKLAELIKDKDCKYLGVDINPKFISWAQKQGINAVCANIKSFEIPECDVVCIQSSLYHFGDQAPEIIDKMLHAAKKRVIIAEPINNVSNSKIGFMKWLSSKVTAVDGQHFPNRFNRSSLNNLLEHYTEKFTLISQNLDREMVVAIDVSFDVQEVLQSPAKPPLS